MNRLRLLASAAGLAALFAIVPATTGQAPSDAQFATIKGQVLLPNPPAEAPANVTTDQAHCLSKGPITNQVYAVNPKNKGLKNVVVYLRPDDTDRKAAFPKDKISPKLATAKPVQHVIDQPCCQFEPRIVAAREGDTLLVKNSAPIPHNINYKSEPGLNQSMAPNAQIAIPGPLVASGAPTPFECNIHPWMKGYVFVYSHPYFAVTDADGKFAISDAPVGKYRIVYRHEEGFHKGKAGALGEVIDIKAGGVELPPVDFVLPPPAK